MLHGHWLLSVGRLQTIQADDLVKVTGTEHPPAQGGAEGSV